MRRHKLFASVLIVLLLVLNTGSIRAQGVILPNTAPSLVSNFSVMPYITGSLNLHSGAAFPANAKGIGFGGGLAFDLTGDGQRTGVYFDFAFQDMRAFAPNGSAVHQNDTVLSTADAEHYWQYILFEPFLKLQTANARGYFMLGASFGFAVLSETVSRGSNKTEFALWEGSPYSNQFRLDLRAAVGIRLADFGKHRLIFEGRFGFPVTNAISNYKNASTDGLTGNWRIITVQGNLGLRL